MAHGPLAEVRKGLRADEVAGSACDVGLGLAILAGLRHFNAQFSRVGAPRHLVVLDATLGQCAVASTLRSLDDESHGEHFTSATVLVYAHEKDTFSSSSVDMHDPEGIRRVPPKVPKHDAGRVITKRYCGTLVPRTDPDHTLAPRSDPDYTLRLLERDKVDMVVLGFEALGDITSQTSLNRLFVDSKQLLKSNGTLILCLMAGESVLQALFTKGPVVPLAPLEEHCLPDKRSLLGANPIALQSVALDGAFGGGAAKQPFMPFTLAASPNLFAGKRLLAKRGHYWQNLIPPGQVVRRLHTITAAAITAAASRWVSLPVPRGPHQGAEGRSFQDIWFLPELLQYAGQSMYATAADMQPDAQALKYFAIAAFTPKLTGV